MTRTVPRTCNLCEAMCGLLLEVEGDRVTSVRGDEDDVLSRGYLCPKAPALAEVYDDPDRLRHPVRRTAAGWERVTWKAAMDEAVDRLAAVRERYGKDAIGLYVGNPTVHNHGAVLAAYGFSRALGSKNRFDANSQDANPKLLASLFAYGDYASITVPDVDRTSYFLVLGANPAVSNGSVMSLGDVRGRLKGIRERGGKIVLFDPRRTEFAGWCDEHHFVRPGGDAALVAAILNVVLSEGAGAGLAGVARGMEELRRAVSRFTPERVAGHVGVGADVVRRVAKDFASAPAAVAYGRIGICQNPFGTLASFLVEALNVVTGNFDRPGGAMFSSPAADTGALARKLLGRRYARWRSRVRGLPEVAGQLPAAVMAEEMETPGEGRIRAFVTLAGNPVLSVPNGERLARALGALDTMVSIDFYLNETTRHAHLVLPPIHALERGHYDVVFHAIAVHNTAKWSPPVFPRPKDTRDDFEILWELGMRLGGMRTGTRVLDLALRAGHLLGLRPSADRLIDLLLRTGPNRLSLAKLAQRPHGIDLGPLEPSRKAKVRTKDGLVDLAPPEVLADADRLDAWLEAPAPALVLIGRRNLRTNNSWMHNCASLARGKDRARVFVHPADAERRGIGDGDRVTVTSRVGSVEARVQVTDEVMQGVVSLPHGHGHAAMADTMRIAATVPGPNVNALTDDAVVDPLSGTAVLSGVPVELERADGLPREELIRTSR